MRKIIEYTIIYHENYFNESFGQMINEMIGKGWQPFGFVFFDKKDRLSHAMVKYEEHKACEADIAALREREKQEIRNVD